VIRSGVLKYLLVSYASQDSFLGPLLRLIPLNATTKQVLSLSRGEQKAYLETLYRFNHKTVTAAPAASKGGVAANALYRIRRTAGLIRRFNQLPCTVESRQARADLLSAESKDIRILVLGDDDLLSVELARRGFRHVTVADCDEVLLQRIRAETADCPTPPRVVQADFRQGFDRELEAMDVVFLDPPYSIDGAKAFLRHAVRAAEGARASRIFLMINPGIFGSRFSEITSVATGAGFRQTRHLPAFNSYPIGLFEATVLRLSWRLILCFPLPKGYRGALHFCSDAFELKR
jgi:hypothetical protein